MAPTGRGKFAVIMLSIVALVAAVVGVLILTGHRDIIPGLAAAADETCPLTGVTTDQGVPDRPALAVKVENLPQARPQAGLNNADVVYEEPVEAGITRFIAIYQCRNAKRIGPIRSGREVDPIVLEQFGTSTLFGYAGGVPQVIDAVKQRGLHDVNFDKAVDAYHRDPNREQPHNLYSSTEALYAAGDNPTDLPRTPFEFKEKLPPQLKPGTAVHIPFSSYSDVHWRWSEKLGAYLRVHGDERHVQEDGKQVKATNVIVQMVRTACSSIVDVNGVCSPEVRIVGSGDAIVFRDGQAIVGTWERQFEEDVTTFRDARGRPVNLHEGTTWVELVPTDVTVEYS